MLESGSEVEEFKILPRTASHAKLAPVTKFNFRSLAETAAGDKQLPVSPGHRQDLDVPDTAKTREIIEYTCIVNILRPRRLPSTL